MASASAASRPASPGSLAAERPAAGHAEGAELRALVGLLLEELVSCRVGAGIAALDIVDAELVEHRGDVALVLEGEIDAGRQRAIAQRGVEEIEAFAGHRV